MADRNPMQPLPDHDNHHNAAVCPYCTHNGTWVMVRADDLRVALRNQPTRIERNFKEEDAYERLRREL